MKTATCVAVMKRTESRVLAEALLAHIGSTLTLEPGNAPCIMPCEGPPEVVRNVLPMFEQSVAWKGRLAADVISAFGKDA